MELYESIAAVRKAAGLTQEQLGALVGVTRQAVSKWESGQAVPDALTVARLCHVLGVSADTLLGIAPAEDGTAEAEAADTDHAPAVCPCCGRLFQGNLCLTCGYMHTVGPKGPKYALILRQSKLVIDEEDGKRAERAFVKYCGVNEEYAHMYVEQLREYGTQIVLRRGLYDTEVQWVASHMPRDTFRMSIVLDDGEDDDTLLAKPDTMELPPPAQPEKQSLGFGGTVLAVVVGIVAAVVLLSFL